MRPSTEDFNSWNEKIKRINFSNTNKPYKEGDIWWCALGINVGSEQNGSGIGQKRPVVILKAIDRKTCYVVPLTTSIKQDKYRILIGTTNGKESIALLNQIRLIDTKRLSVKLTSVDPCMFLYIREAARKLF